jgi:uncharacterized repeat protein (TIGR01451 family)
MEKIFRTSLFLFILLVLSACNLGGAPNTTVTGDTPVLRLTVQTRDGASTFSATGEVINYNYVITNTGTTPLAGPVIVTDAPRGPSCPDVATIGNLDTYLDLNETITCTSTHTVTEVDVSTGSITNLATANAGGVVSNQTGITLTRSVAAQTLSTLTLTKTASSQTYGQIGQTITYNYTITNIGTAPLGPDQFVINDNKLAAPLPCGPAGTTLAPSQSITCSAPYLITQADMSAANVTNSAYATGAGQQSPPASATVTNLTAAATQTPPTPQTATLAPSSNLAPGSTFQHPVAVGEWLIQIGRCYGASFDDIRNANPQIADPDFILPFMIVSVPRIGSAGRIWGPPCITFHTVQSGDTWESIAQRYDADLVVLRKVNPVTLTPGIQLKIPLHSAGFGGVTPAPGTATFTPTATATATTGVTAQRITFDPGQTTASRTGIINPNETIQFVLTAAPGQMLTVNLTGPANTEATLGVSGPTGLALKQPDGTFTWSSAISTGGDHYINIKSGAGTTQKAYTLTVSLTTAVTPATATPTATSTTAPGSP